MTPYVSIVEAATYFESRMFTSAWDLALQIDRSKALADATRRINLLAFAGTKTDSSQENEFPRNGDTDVLTNIKYACCEIALSLLEGIDPEKENKELTITSQGFSGVRSTYDRTTVQDHIGAGIPSVTAWAYLKPYLRNKDEVKLCRV